MHDPHWEGHQKSRVFADTQPKVVMNALAKQPFADFNAEQKGYKIRLADQSPIGASLERWVSPGRRSAVKARITPLAVCSSGPSAKNAT